MPKRSLGNTYLAMGQLERAESTFNCSLTYVQQSDIYQDEISAAFFSLGNLALIYFRLQSMTKER